MSAAPELSIVIPAHNEATLIGDTVRAWDAETRRLGVTHEILVYDDGSVDETGSVLTGLAGDVPGLVVVRHSNRGHGPTILRGYRDARGVFVLQVDADDEVGVEPFESLWMARHDCDLQIGRRLDRGQAPGRRALSWCSRVMIGALFGRGIRDVNSPYRLMRRTALDALVAVVPDDTFSPNTAISGLAVRNRLRVREVDVRVRRRGSRGAANWRVWAAARLSFVQHLAIARRARASTVGPQRRT
jgi:glycosyltransferase involved in cell wall biosynthesis